MSFYEDSLASKLLDRSELYITTRYIFRKQSTIKLKSSIIKQIIPSYNLVLPVFDCIIFIFVFHRYGVIVDPEAFLKIFGREALPIKYKS